jgi:transposase
MDTEGQTYATSRSRDEGYAGRIEVVTGPSGRRRWPEHVKAALVLESFRDGASVADVARRHGVSAPQLDTRKNLRDLVVA